MRRVLRSVTVTLGFLAMQLAVLQGAAACLSPHRSAVGAQLMPMTGMAATATDAGEPKCDAPDGGCRVPAQRDQHCTTMVSCAFSLAAPTTMTLAVARPAMPSKVAGISVRTPPSYNVAPELPPPRS